MVFYIYKTSLKLIPNLFPPVTLSIFIFVSIGYSCLLHNIIFEFSSFDLWSQNKIILFSFLGAICSYFYKDKIKHVITSELLKYAIEISSVVSIHLSLYDTSMTDLSIFLYTFSCSYIFWEVIRQYKLSININDNISKTFLMIDQ
jgi:hypothetical protein